MTQRPAPSRARHARLPLALSRRAGADTYARRLSAAASLIGRSTERYPHHGGGPAMGGDRAPATGGDRAPATGGDRAPVSADRRVVSIAARGSASIGPMSSRGVPTHRDHGRRRAAGRPGHTGDAKPGDTNGQRVTAFDAAWFAVSGARQVVSRPASKAGGTIY